MYFCVKRVQQIPTRIPNRRAHRIKIRARSLRQILPGSEGIMVRTARKGTERIRPGRPRNPDYQLMETQYLRAEVKRKKVLCRKGRSEFIQRWPALTRAAKERVVGKTTVLDQEIPRRTRLGVKNGRPMSDETKANIRSAWIRKQFMKLNKWLKFMCHPKAIVA